MHLEGAALEKEVKRALDEYLDKVVREVEQEGSMVAARILRSLVDEGSEGGIVRDWNFVSKVVEETGVEDGVARAVLDSLYDRRLVERRHETEKPEYKLVHDFLAETIRNVYDDKGIRFHKAAAALVDNFGVALRANMSEDSREDLAFTHVKDFWRNYHPIHASDLTEGQRQAVVAPFILPSESLKKLIVANLDKSAAGACLVVDILLQLLYMFGSYGRARELQEAFAQLLRARGMESLAIEYEHRHGAFWQQVLEDRYLAEPSAGDLKGDELRDRDLMRELLRMAQQERSYSLPRLRGRLSLKSRLPLWRLIRKLEMDGQLYRETAGDLSPEELFSFEWTFAPQQPYLEAFGALEDARAYQGVMFHFPAGEHAMRNQRAAKKVLIRTVAAERGARGTAPGWREADDQKLLQSQADSGTEFEQMLFNIGLDNAVMLNRKKSKMWVVLEAQEYSAEEMINLCEDVEKRLGEKGARIEGKILADISQSIANRKDLTRGLGTLADVPQPAYRVLSTESSSPWEGIWQECMVKAGFVTQLPVDIDWQAVDEAEEEPKKVWLDALKEAVRAVGDRAMVKPVVTEFLKGGTPVDIEDEGSLELAWNRARTSKFIFPNVVVEELKGDIEKELMVTLVRRGDGSYVRVPPIWYKCVRDFAWEKDLKHKSVPMAMDYAWVEPDSGNGTSHTDDAIFETALRHSIRVAEKMWDEIEAMHGKVYNHFLEFEWLVLKDGTVALNEIKPTQLDKGIISNDAFSLSDSDLLVRNLFDLPLPDTVKKIRPTETILVGAILTNRNDLDVPKIVEGRQLISYSRKGIRHALELGADLFLYSDKMRSKPYIGRRMGVVTIIGKSLEEAEQTLAEVRAALEPRYGE